MALGATARALVRDRIHAALSGVPAEGACTAYPEELESVAYLLDECKDMLAFRDAEHAALLDEAYVVASKASWQKEAIAADLEQERFNYALAEEAVAVLQSDPDATCVEPMPRPKALVGAYEHALDEQQASHDAAVAALRAEHADALAALVDAHQAELSTLAFEDAEALRDAEAAHAAAAETMRTEHASALDTLACTHASALERAHHTAADAQRALAEAQTALGEAHQHTSDVHAQHAAFAERMNAALGTLQDTVHTNGEWTAALRQRLAAWEDADAHAHAAATRALSDTAARAAAAERDAADAQHTLATHQAEFEAKSTRLHETERRLAVLQREMEQTRETHANVVALEQRAGGAETRAAQLQAELNDVAPLRAAAAQLQGEVAELHTLISMHKASAAQAEQDQLRAEEREKELYVADTDQNRAAVRGRAYPTGPRRRDGPAERRTRTLPRTD